MEKIIFSRVHSNKMQFETANNKILVDITDSDGPEISLSDGTKIVFKTVQQRYRIMSDKEVSNIEAKEFNVEAFKKKYFKVSDEVYHVKFDYDRSITLVEEYSVMNLPVYRIFIE